MKNMERSAQSADVPGANPYASVSARKIDMAKKLIEALSENWHHGKYKDAYRDQLLSLIKHEAKGEVIEVAAPIEEP